MTMKWYHNLYIGEELQNKKEEIIFCIEQGKRLFNTYIIVLAQYEKNHLEIYDSLLLQQSLFAEDSLIVGIATGYNGALQLIESITREVYDTTGTTNLRHYILEKQLEFED